MKKIKFQFYATDYTPLLLANGKNSFYLKTNCRKKLNEQDQRDILILFLKRAQEEIDNILLDKSLSKDEKCIYTYFDQKMYFGGLVGVISVADITIPKISKKVDISLQINTRFDAMKSKGCEIKPNFLLHLLFNDCKLINNKVDEGKDQLFDLLLLNLFIEKYGEAYAKGYYKTYHEFEKNDDRIRGSIDVSRHIQLNMGLENCRVAYSYREKSEDNYINHLIVSAYEKLKKKYEDILKDILSDKQPLQDSLESLKFLIGFPKYSDNSIVLRNIERLKHPYYTEYECLREICIKILRDEKQSMFNGDRRKKINGILRYVPRLWEKYLEKKFKKIGIKNFRSQKEINVFCNDDNARQLTIPDFVFYKGKKPFMILDAKFKPGWMESSKSGKLGDLLSDYDKCIRDMVSINGHATGVIFPTDKRITYEQTDNTYKVEGDPYLFVHKVSEFNAVDNFYTFPIYVPAGIDKYKDWRSEFEKNNDKLFEEIKHSIVSILEDI